MRLLVLPSLLVALLLGGTSAPAQVVNVVLKVVDQYGNEIVGSQLKSDSIPWTTSGDTVSLMQGTHEFVILPVLIAGRRLDLGRSEFATVTSSTSQLTFTWITAPVQLRVRDQHGVDIPNSEVIILGSDVHRYPAGSTVTLPITDTSVYPTIWPSYASGYRIALRPGFPGTSRSFDLFREEHGNQVTASTTALTFEWITTTVTLRLQDQYGQEIPNSFIGFDVLPGPITFPTGTSVTLPVTDNAVYPTISSGVEAEGYNVFVGPGFPGTTRLLDLRREIDGNEVSPATSTFTFEWITQSVLLRVVDQFGAEVPGSVVWFERALPARIGFPTGSTVTLPITDESVYPGLYHAEANGYGLAARPGVNWSNRPATTADLARFESREVLQSTASIVFDWHVVECPIALRLAGGPEVPGVLFFESPHSAWATGATVWLPITENSVYPDLAGNDANGYTITVRPDGVAPLVGTFQFEMLQSGAFEPATFVIGDNTYSLFCRTNTPPNADAGSNLTIVTSQVASTTIAGSASDGDGQALIYRWLEGANVLFGPTPVASGGTAPLPLANATALGVGTHELVLEVTDGIDTATARMWLTIGNSPPVAMCSGAGTYQAGADTVILRGTVADHDGDLVSWSWWHGTTLLGSGTVTPATGGAPTSLPALLLSTGIGGALGIGTHALQLRVHDSQSTIIECEATVVVVDNEAPRLAPVADCTILWPPNHALVPITITANAVDVAGGPVLLNASVHSSEDAYKDGSGNTIPDFTEPMIDHTTGRIHLFLRAERSGKGPGRTYTITITATDQSSNRSTAQVVVTAPHDRG